MKQRHYIALACLAFLLASAAAWAETTDVKSLQAAQQEEKRLLEELDALEHDISRIEDRMIPLEEQADQLRDKLVQGDRNLKDVQERSDRLQKYLGRRIRAIHRLKPAGILEMLLEADSLSDLIHRYRYITVILRQDERSIHDFGRQRDQIFVRQQEYKNQQARLYDLRAELSSERDRLVRNKHLKTALLMKVHQKKELFLAMVASREESRQLIVNEVMVDAPEKPAGKAEAPPAGKAAESWPDFTAQKGKLPKPVDGKVTARFGTQTGPFNTPVKNYGITYAAPAGAPVRAVLDGRVMHVGWLRGYGNIIIVHHGRRYYTMIGGAAGIKTQVDQWVKQGDVIGWVPKDGQDDQESIYFEIRHGGEALNPAGWLRSEPTARVDSYQELSIC